MADKRMSELAHRVHELLEARIERLERESQDAMMCSFILDGAPVDGMTDDKARARLREIMANNGIKEHG